MNNREKPRDGVIISSQANDVKAIDGIVAEVAGHKTLAKDIQSALAGYYRAEGNVKKASKIAGCGVYLQIRQYEDMDNTTKLYKGSWCMHPMCPLCAWRKHLKNAVVLAEAISGMDNLYLLTLTVDNTQKITREDIRGIIAKSTAMMRDVLQIRDYAANLEITEHGKGYHPHIHAIVRQPYWSAHNIRENMAYWRKKWGETAGGQHGYNLLHIASINHSGGAVAEVTKYITKLSVSADMEQVISDLIPALHGIRQLRTAGEIKQRIAGIKIDLKVEELMEKIKMAGYDYRDYVACWIGGKYDVRPVLKWRDEIERRREIEIEMAELNQKLQKALSRQG